ncbi:MAG: MoaD/ThiS family protein [Thaumarchaeota archaeon]|nr:MoaD/ThiS family protein [Candidatus Calditenuaceae archaeon]MDW8041276.1 MoaD/ThiS family protein [Nitrososphaerota archaeon]
MRDVLGRAGKISVELREDADVKSLLNVLARWFGEKFTQEVLNEDELPEKSIKIYVNGRDVDFPNGLSKVVKDGDEGLCGADLTVRELERYDRRLRLRNLVWTVRVG